MIDLKNWYRERLAVRISALEAARRRLAAEAGDSVDSIRRIARSLRETGATFGFPGISEEARRLEEAEGKEIPGRVDRLLSVLREAASEGRTGKTAILVVEDDPEQACFMEGLLKGADRELILAGTAAEAEEILSRRTVSLILLDLILPDMDGRNLLLKLRERPATAGIPVLVVTIKRAEEARDECLSLGADGFLEKPVNPASLQVAVAGRLAVGSDLSRACRLDPLTGLPNRAAFREMFERLSPLYADPPGFLSLGLLDVDGLRKVNEEHGKAVGDQVLRRAAAVFSAALRASDFLSYWGGGTFAALFPATDRTGAVRALEKARRLLKRERFQTGGDRVVRITMSAGVVEVRRGQPLEEILLRADRWLFRAKTSGRDRVAGEGGEAPAPPLRVFLAEDDELMTAMIRFYLERDGFEVSSFDNGAAALQAALRNPPSLLVTDVRMPGMDGFELLRRIRSIPSLARLPVVVVTSMGDEEDLRRGFELGADEYVLKPFSPSDLMVRLRRLLRRR